MHDLPQAISEAIEAADVPPLPQILLRLLQAVEDENVTIGELAGIVDKDPALAARVLAAANSAAFRRTSPVLSVESCLQTLGLRVVKSIATCLAVKRLFDDPRRHWQADLSGFWRHSLLTADISRSLAVHCGYQRPEEAYLAGLLHDVGELVMCSAFRDRYGRVLAASASETALAQLEAAEFGAGHPQVGAWLIDQWQLDAGLADGVLFHHESEGSIATADRLPRFVWLANACAAECHGGDQLSVWGEALLGLDAPALQGILSEAQGRMRTIADAMGIPVPPAGQAETAAACLPRNLRCHLPEATEDEPAWQRAVGGKALLQPLQDIFLSGGSEDELLAALRESARILFGIGHAAFLLVDPAQSLLCGERGDDLPEVLRDFRRPLATAGSLACHALASGTIRSSFVPVAAEPAYLVDVQLARALRSEGLLCLPLSAEAAPGLGVMVMGLSAGQHEALWARREALARFARVAAAGIRSLRAGKARQRAQDEAALERSSRNSRRVAHEAGNPLGIIKSYLMLLNAKLPESLGLQPELDVLREEIDRVSAIIHRMASEPGAAADDGAVNLNAVIRELAILYGDPLCRNRDIELTLDLDADEPVAHGDRGAMKQIFINLLKNASEAQGAGGRIRVETRGPVVMDGRAWSEASIEDSGPGLPPAALARLQGAEDEGTGANGRGMGLAIVNSLAARLGARLAYRSGRDRGSRISIWLPATGEQQPTSRKGT